MENTEERGDPTRVPTGLKDIIARKQRELDKCRDSIANYSDQCWLTDKKVKLRDKELVLESELSILLSSDQRLCEFEERVSGQTKLDLESAGDVSDITTAMVISSSIPVPPGGFSGDAVDVPFTVQPCLPSGDAAEARRPQRGLCICPEQATPHYHQDGSIQTVAERQAAGAYFFRCTQCDKLHQKFEDVFPEVCAFEGCPCQAFLSTSEPRPGGEQVVKHPPASKRRQQRNSKRQEAVA